LIKFIALLSEFDPEYAATCVAKDYYPLKECLIEVKKKKNKMAEAVLI